MVGLSLVPPTSPFGAPPHWLLSALRGLHLILPDVSFCLTCHFFPSSLSPAVPQASVSGPRPSMLFTHPSLLHANAPSPVCPAQIPSDGPNTQLPAAPFRRAHSFTQQFPHSLITSTPLPAPYLHLFQGWARPSIRLPRPHIWDLVLFHSTSSPHKISHQILAVLKSV